MWYESHQIKGNIVERKKRLRGGRTFFEERDIVNSGFFNKIFPFLEYRIILGSGHGR
jgi:hypothetical protein